MGPDSDSSALCSGFCISLLLCSLVPVFLVLHCSLVPVFLVLHCSLVPVFLVLHCSLVPVFLVLHCSLVPVFLVLHCSLVPVFLVLHCSLVPVFLVLHCSVTCCSSLPPPTQVSFQRTMLFCVKSQVSVISFQFSLPPTSTPSTRR